MASLGAKIITLSVTDQNLLRVALTRAVEGFIDDHGTSPVTDLITMANRIADLKARLV